MVGGVLHRGSRDTSQIKDIASTLEPLVSKEIFCYFDFAGFTTAKVVSFTLCANGFESISRYGCKYVKMPRVVDTNHCTLPYYFCSTRERIDKLKVKRMEELEAGKPIKNTKVGSKELERE